MSRGTWMLMRRQSCDFCRAVGQIFALNAAPTFDGWVQICSSCLGRLQRLQRSFQQSQDAPVRLRRLRRSDPGGGPDAVPRRSGAAAAEHDGGCLTCCTADGEGTAVEPIWR